MGRTDSFHQKHRSFVDVVPEKEGGWDGSCALWPVTTRPITTGIARSGTIPAAKVQRGTEITPALENIAHNWLFGLK
jgi:hypothetical protein